MIDITLVFFIYGLAFFSMGVTLLFETERSPLVAEARALVPLAIFGLVHGSHEWLEMFLDKSDWLVFRNPQLVGWLRVGILAFSFVCLILFGLRMFHPRRRYSRNVILLWGLLLTVYIGLIVGVGVLLWPTGSDPISQLDVLVRYSLAVPGALIAGLALYRQAYRAHRQELNRLSAGLYLAAFGFVIYSLTQMVVRPLDAFPANLINTITFTRYMGFPVQVIRAAVAILIALGLMRATNAAEDERQRQFLAAQQARVEALEQVKQELAKREAMRQELLRHIVVAQEDERARIARELHDETAQVLTAFTFHLAAMRDSATKVPKVREQVDYLMALSRQMSQGIYRLFHDLRPAQLDDLGLPAALQYLVDEEHRRLSLDAKLIISGERRRLDALVETVFYRAAQEALTNVARHAGVQSASLHLQFDPHQVVLSVSDEGKGFNLDDEHTDGHGWGLAGMRERAESVGGTLEVQSTPGKGTLVKIVVPWNMAAPKRDEDHADMQQRIGENP
jgi:signal transduction histidine kinase